MPSLQPVHFPKDILEGTDRRLGTSQEERSLSFPLFGRHPFVSPQPRSASQAQKKKLLSTLVEFGWLVNLKKSLLTPTQSMIYLGALFNTSPGTVRLPPRK